MFSRAHIRALEVRIEDLKAQLADERKERQALLNRLLEKHNVAPITPSDPQPRTPTIEIINPYGVLTPELEDATRESWLREEMDYIRMTQGIEEPERLRSLAEDSYISHHQVLK